ncbi:MAG: PD40 domain-containing protein [Deltaproteobacteria bacterium]|nr:PD40 domain-containing protein [Deltaproteobacteria bacterium]
MRTTIAVMALLMLACACQPEGTPVRVHDGTAGPFLVSPRWSADGRRLECAGLGGAGAYALDLDAARLTRAETAPAERSQHGRAGELRYEAYRGRILAGGGLLAEDAWAPAASPDGSRVAYCLGHLSAATLVVQRTDGAVELRVPGAQPAWTPGGGLVFCRPEAARGPDGRIVIAASDLFVLAPGAREPQPLTRTPEIAEMQPAVSPDGARVACSDWRTGSLWVYGLEGVRP